MNYPLISVIVPVYNVQDYLDKCIESLVNQSYKNMEIILIDDGSSDNSPLICSEWADKDKRIKLFHQENQGVSSARNYGISEAKGEYAAFVDSDDWLDYDTLEITADTAISNNADIVCFGFQFEYSDGKSSMIPIKEFLSENDDVLKSYILDNVRTEVWGKLYRKDLISDIRFDAQIKYAEDYLFNYYAMKKCRKLISKNLCKYHYLQDNEASATAPFITVPRAESYKIAKKILDEQVSGTELYNAALWRYIVRLFALITRVCKCNDEFFMNNYFDVYRNEIIQYKKEIMNGNFSKKQKIAVCLLDKLPAVYKLITKEML